MDFNNFENQTFDTLPETIIGSNFENCTFNASARFERCNIKHSTFTKDHQYFYLSNVIVCTGIDGSTFDKSNRIDEEDELMHKRFENEEEEENK